MLDEGWSISCTNGGGASVLRSTELLHNIRKCFVSKLHYTNLKTHVSLDTTEWTRESQMCVLRKALVLSTVIFG